MKISGHFQLNKSQYELDFVDIDPSVDTPLFLDPYFISKCDFEFATRAHTCLKSFFDYLLLLLKNGNITKAEEIFSHLGENNDICLGMSQGYPEGKGMGPSDTVKIFNHLRRSKAISSGIMEDIEDLRIFVDNIDKDKVSDMTSNIIRKQLLEYTIEQCRLLNIPLEKNRPSGMYWDSTKLTWECSFIDRLIVNNKPILLVPKRLVSFSSRYTAGYYRQHFVLNFLQNENLRLGSKLVQIRKKDNTVYVTKKSIKESEPPMDKNYLLNFSLKYIDEFKKFKQADGDRFQPISGNGVESISVKSISNILKDKLKSINPGSEEASKYHDLMIGILEFLFYPNLSSPKKEREIHSGRKRIDITFENTTTNGFFWKIQSSTKLPAPRLYIECKNYVQDIHNPELDQLAGRFSPQRGRIGILCCRKLTNIDVFLKRCADTYKDDRGLILPISDSDIIEALDAMIEDMENPFENILDKRYRGILDLC